jgi:hypothetical protein
MARILTKLRIAKATAALQESVASIIGCDENDATKREALVETFAQFQTYMERNGGEIAKAGDHDDGGDNIDKAHRDRGVGPHGLTGALLEHLHDRLERRREQHGYQKREEGPLDQHQELISIMKDHGGPVSLCKALVDRGRSPCGEHELVAALTKAARSQRPELSPASAFARLFETEESVRSACNIAKAAEFSVFDIKPVVVSGPDAMHEANDDDDSAVLRAHEEIVRIAREKFPFLPADVAFTRVFEDKNYAALAAQAHSRPSATTIYQTPRATPGNAAYAKSDPVPNADSAYGELMAKAAEYGKAHPELTEAQAFTKVFTAPANVELAKRERLESAPR